MTTSAIEDRSDRFTVGDDLGQFSFVTAFTEKKHSSDDEVICRQGHRHGGTYGAAGILIRAPRPSGKTAYLLQQRAADSDCAGKWGVFGGGLHAGETPLAGATREVNEEIGSVHVISSGTEPVITKVGPHGYVHGWIKVPDGGIPVTEDDADAAAEAMSRGHDIGAGAAQDRIREGTREWTRGLPPDKAADPQSLAAFHLVVAHARPAAPELMRGLAVHESLASPSHAFFVHSLRSAHPGDKITVSKPASWTSDEVVAHEFATRTWDRQHSDTVKPGYSSVMLKLQPGAHAVSIERYAVPEYQEQKEWVTPPSSYDVVSNEPHPSVKGMRVVTLKESSS